MMEVIGGLAMLVGGLVLVAVFVWTLLRGAARRERGWRSAKRRHLIAGVVQRERRNTWES